MGVETFGVFFEAIGAGLLLLPTGVVGLRATLSSLFCAYSGKPVLGVVAAFLADIAVGVLAAGAETDLCVLVVFLGVAFGVLAAGVDPARPFGVCLLGVLITAFTGVFSTFGAGEDIFADGVFWTDLGVLPRGLCSETGELLVGDGD